MTRSRRSPSPPRDSLSHPVLTSRAPVPGPVTTRTANPLAALDRPGRRLTATLCAVAPLLALWLAGLCSTTLRAEDPTFELSQLPPAAEGAIDYEQQIAPLLANKCASCHGAKRQRSDLRVDTRGALLKGGSRGPAAVPSQPARSWLLAAASRQIEELAMPPEGVAGANSFMKTGTSL